MPFLQFALKSKKYELKKRNYKLTLKGNVALNTLSIKEY